MIQGKAMLSILLLLHVVVGSKTCIFIHGLGMEEYRSLSRSRIIKDLEEAKNSSTFPESRKTRLTISQYWGNLPEDLEFCEEKYFADFDTTNLDLNRKFATSNDGVSVLCEWLEKIDEPISAITHSMGAIILGAALGQCPSNKQKVRFLSAIATPWKGSTSLHPIFEATLIGLCESKFKPLMSALGLHKYCSKSYPYLYSDEMLQNWPISSVLIRKEALSHLADVPRKVQVCEKEEDMVLPSSSCTDGPDQFELDGSISVNQRDSEMWKELGWTNHPNTDYVHESITFAKQTSEFINNQYHCATHLKKRDDGSQSFEKIK